MLLRLAILFFTPIISGLLVFLFPQGRTRNFRLLLVFAGAYLFGITVVHILPELFRNNAETELIGLFVLVGFFLQQILEHVTSGIEHGHIHTDDHHHHHHGKPISAVFLLLALCVHAFLEGAMLTQLEEINLGYDINAILLGIVLHRTPAAFALMTVLVHQLNSRTKALPYLLIFSLAAPAGLLVSSLLAESSLLTASGLNLLYAVVSGNFLHISTTIVFESSPEHKFNARKLTVAILGAMMAVVIEYLM
ncbi:MAG: ZIP family metal transporter [Cyclobacteriaceae bacterium]|nr:ZIP family metal transporter [Cyclobacteriaceae bacterium]